MSGRSRLWPLHMDSRSYRLLALLLLLPLSAALAACGGGGTAASTETSGRTSTAGATTTTATTETTATTGTTDTSDTSGTSTAETTDTRPTIGNLVASPDNVRCAYVPHGSLSGADQLTIFFFILLIGATPQQLPGLVAVQATSDTGSSTQLRSGVSNRGATAVQLDLDRRRPPERGSRGRRDGQPHQGERLHPVATP